MLTAYRKLRTYPWQTLELAFTAFLWQASTGVFLLSLVQQYLTQQLDANAAFPGYALAIYAAARFLLQAPSGWLADRFGRRRTLTLGIAISFPSVVLMMQVQDATSFLAFSALFGAGSAAIWPAIMSYVGDTHHPSVRAKTLNMLNVAQLLGLGLGTLAGILLTDYISYTAAFVACLAFNGLALVFAYRGARLASRNERVDVATPEEKQGIGWKMFSPQILLLAAIALLFSIATSVQAPAIGAYADEVLDTRLSVLGLMLAVPGAIGGFLAIRYGHIADRFGRQIPLVGGLAVAAACYFSLGQITNPLLAANVVVIAALAYAVSIPAWGAAALDATEFGRRGLVLGSLATVQAFGGTVGQAVGGITNAAWGPVAPFKLGGVLLVLALVLALVHLRQHRRALQPALS